MSEGLINAFILDGKGGGEEISWDQVEKWNPDKGILWVHINVTSKQSIKWLKNASGLDQLDIDAMIMDDTRPRTVISPKGLMVFLRGVNLNPGQDPEDMVSIRIWMEKNRIITACRRKLLSIEDVVRAVKEGRGANTPPEFLSMLNDRLISRMREVVDLIEDQVDEIEECVATIDSYSLRAKLADIRRQAISIRRFLAPQREALNKLYFEGISLFSEKDRFRILEGADRIVKYIEDLDSARERAAVTQEELNSNLAEQTNKRMYILSLVAAVFLPLSFVTGLLGINVAGIPGQNYKWAFLFVCLSLIVVSILILLILRKTRWI